MVGDTLLPCLRFAGWKLSYTRRMDEDTFYGCGFVVGLYLLIYMLLLLLGVLLHADVSQWPVCRVPLMAIAAGLLLLVILNVILSSGDNKGE